MLPSLKQAKKMRWIKAIDNTYPKQKYIFVSDGMETQEDIKYMINWADTWSEVYGYEILDNYNDLKAKLS